VYACFLFRISCCFALYLFIYCNQSCLTYLLSASGRLPPFPENFYSHLPLGSNINNNLTINPNTRPTCNTYFVLNTITVTRNTSTEP